MFVDKWKPLYAPDLETGAGEEIDQAPPPEVGQEQPDGPGSGRSQLRRQLEKGFDDDRKATAAAEREQRKPQHRKGPNHLDADTEIEGRAPEGQEDKEVQTVAPPAGLAKEAQAEWAQVPPVVQAAVVKRLQDSERGVEDLKKRYGELDQALQPRMEMIKQHGHTPAQAVNQLFLWFEALAKDVDRVREGKGPAAFTALAQSFGLDPTKLFASQAQPEKKQEQPKPDGVVPVEIAPEIKDYITKLEGQVAQLASGLDQKISMLGQNFERQSYAKTEEILNTWSKDKAHFEEVRQMMAHLIASGAVQPLPNGSADLDRAYDMALYALPDVRTKVLAEQKAAADKAAKEKRDAELRAQQEQANKARRASGGSLTVGAPGSPPAPGQKGKKTKSVRESIADAMEELNS